MCIRRIVDSIAHSMEHSMEHSTQHTAFPLLLLLTAHLVPPTPHRPVCLWHFMAIECVLVCVFAKCVSNLHTVLWCCLVLLRVVPVLLSCVVTVL